MSMMHLYLFMQEEKKMELIKNYQIPRHYHINLLQKMKLVKKYIFLKLDRKEILLIIKNIYGPL